MRPTTARNSEVFPTPLRPSKHVTAPTSAVSDTWRNAIAAP